MTRGSVFAVPAETIRELLPRLKQGKDLLPGRLGVNMPQATLYTADSTLPIVRPQSPAYKAGFRSGDRIVAIDGRKIELAAEAKQEISRRYAGDKMRIAVLRGKERIERDVALVAKLDPFQTPFLGILPMRHSGAGAGAKSAGVQVRYVFPDGPAAKGGIQPGDVLTAVAGAKLNSPAQLPARLQELQPADHLAIEFRRGENVHHADVVLGEYPENIPAGPLPPARSPGKPSTAKRPQVGAIHLKMPDLAGETWAYVPENYDPSAPPGIFTWFPRPGEINPAEILPVWKEFCDRDGLILVVPKSMGPVRWERWEARVVAPLLTQIAAQYRVDPTRIVVGGRQSGGQVALAAGFRYPQVVRAVVAADAPWEGEIPEPDPAHRLAFYLASSAKSGAAKAIGQSIAGLRQQHYPVIVKDLGSEPREWNAAETAELARWIDSLDRM